jgi:hypothetical protein
VEETRTQYLKPNIIPKGATVMGQLDTSPIPPYAVTMWATNTDIFVALPMTAGGIPYITKYPLNEGGLSMAISVLCARQKESISPTAASPANYTIPKEQPQVKLSKVQEKLRSETTPEQRQRARDMLAKLGIK